MQGKPIICQTPTLKDYQLMVLGSPDQESSLPTTSNSDLPSTVNTRLVFSQKSMGHYNGITEKKDLGFFRLLIGLLNS